MATIKQSPSSVVIDENTVERSIGLCYFDTQSETLIEISQLPDMFLSVEPEGSAVRKFYLVTSPVEILSWVQIYMESSDPNSNTYSVKVIISEDEPPASAFDILPSFNSFKIINPTPGNFNSVWLLIENTSKANEIVGIDIRLTYE